MWGIYRTSSHERAAIRSSVIKDDELLTFAYHAAFLAVDGGDFCGLGCADDDLQSRSISSTIVSEARDAAHLGLHGLENDESLPFLDLITLLDLHLDHL